MRICSADRRCTNCLLLDRHCPSFSLMSLSLRMSTVEQQLVMHFLHTHEISKLARCNRSLLHAANAPFAFKHAPPVRCAFPSGAHHATRRASKSELCLRFVPVILEWTLPAALQPSAADSTVDSTQPQSDLDSAVEQLLLFGNGACRLHGLDLQNSTRSPSNKHWSRITASAAIQQIRFLALPRLHNKVHHVRAELIALLIRLPLLATLRIGDAAHEEGGPCMLQRLCDLPALTQLDCVSYSNTFPRMCLQSIALCRGLQSLRFSGGDLSALVCLESSPSLPLLRRVRIDRGSFFATSTGDFVRVLSQMPSLELLHLSYCHLLLTMLHALPSLLSHYPLPPSFRVLCIQPNLWDSSEGNLLLALVRVLTAVPSLRIELRLKADVKAHTVCGAAMQREFESRAHAQYTESHYLAPFRDEGRFWISWPQQPNGVDAAKS